jgi:hypothetical protein
MSYRFVRFLSYAAVLVLSPVTFLYAQTQASCTFKLFKPAIASGVNDWGTTVGGLNHKAAIRYAGGGITYFMPPGAVDANFTARNNSGVTVGTYIDALDNVYSFMLKGTTVTPIRDPKSLPPSTTWVSGMNRWNSIVGNYADPEYPPYHYHGFKRYSDGRYVDLDYPFVKVPNVTQYTYPNGINDNGVVVGSYNKGGISEHGFIYQNGRWATLDVPNSATTTAVGISNAGAIAISTSKMGSFLYVNGKFKTIKVPNSTSTHVNGMSAGGLITGYTTIGTAAYGFVGLCD